eukprot:gene10452-20296_t
MFGHGKCVAVLSLAAAAACRDIKVLSFIGITTGPNIPGSDVNNQHKCFEKDLIPGVTIRANKSMVINAKVLKGYDVLLMPGGVGGIYLAGVDVEAVRSFVSAGVGFYGTCAGAYAGCARVIADPRTGLIDPYTGRTATPTGNDSAGAPIYPTEQGLLGVSRARCHVFPQMGTSQNLMTAAGTKLFGLTGDVPIDHHNGPAMDGDGATVAAVFDSTYRKGKASIVLDTFGAGRSILISPHPEHRKLQNCLIVSWAAAYAGGVDGPRQAPPAGGGRAHGAQPQLAAPAPADTPGSAETVAAGVNADPRNSWRAAAGGRAAARRPGTDLPFAPYAYGATSPPLRGAPASFDARTQWP